MNMNALGYWGLAMWSSSGMDLWRTHVSNQKASLPDRLKKCLVLEVAPRSIIVPAHQKLELQVLTGIEIYLSHTITHVLRSWSSSECLHCHKPLAGSFGHVFVTPYNNQLAQTSTFIISIYNKTLQNMFRKDLK